LEWQLKLLSYHMLRLYTLGVNSGGCKTAFPHFLTPGEQETRERSCCVLLLLEKQRVRVLFSFHHHLSFVAAIFIGREDWGLSPIR
jgi:hypothetical protein